MLRYLSTGSDFASTGDSQLRHCKTTVHDCIWEVVDFLYFNHERYIRFPQTPDELEACARLYDVEKYNFKPYCVGSVDCTQIGVKTPSQRWQEEAFVNRKSYKSINTMVPKLNSYIHILTSILLTSCLHSQKLICISLNMNFFLQLIVDAEGKILHVDATFPGSASDAYIFNQSEVRDFGDRGFFGKYFLLGDSG